MKTTIVLTFVLFLLISPSVGQCPFEKEAIKDAGTSAKEAIKDAGNFVKEAAQGAGDMWRAYTDMREANHIGADKYFHSRGNSDAAERGPGGKWAAEVISDVREFLQGADKEDSKADQEANEWGRSGGDPNKYRPEGLPNKY